MPTTLHSSSGRDRKESEFADLMPLLHRMAVLAADDPQRAQLRDRIVTAFLPVGERLAQVHSRATPWVRDDLRQVAAEAIVQAVDRWDPELARGEFLGYLVPCIRGSILRFFRDQSWSVRVPRRLKEVCGLLHRAVPELTQTLGRAPRPTELARHLGLELDEVLEALRAEESRSATPLDGQDDEPGPVERLGTEDRRLGLVEDLQVLAELLPQLPEREREIVRLRFYEDRTQTQIAAEIGISQMHVSRLLSRSLGRLRRGLLDDSAPRAGHPRPAGPPSGPGAVASSPTNPPTSSRASTSGLSGGTRTTGPSTEDA